MAQHPDTLFCSLCVVLPLCWKSTQIIQLPGLVCRGLCSYDIYNWEKQYYIHVACLLMMMSFLKLWTHFCLFGLALDFTGEHRWSFFWLTVLFQPPRPPSPALQPLYYWRMAFNASSASSKTPPGRKEFLRMNGIQLFSIFPPHALKCSKPFHSLLDCFFFLAPLFPPTIPLLLLRHLFLPQYVLCVRWSGAPVQAWHPGES